MSEPKTKPGTLKCPWCGKITRYHKGRLSSHVSPGGTRCVGIGQPKHTVESLLELRANMKASNDRR